MGHGTLLAGRYRLEERVRSGADGSTWRAVDENRDRQVQVRLLRPGHPHAAEVVDAARRAALVSDQRLARVLGVADGSLVYVVSEYVQGKDLGALVAQSPLPGETVRRIIGEAAQALDRADSRGLHHLRLSPASIAVDREGAVKVLGTGVDAAAAGIEPDQWASRTDALDLVKLLYAGLTGRWPGGEAEGLEEAPRVAGRAVPPGDLMTGVPGDLDSLCETTLGHDDGPRSPGELAAALSPWAEAAPLGPPGGLAAAGPSRPIPVIGLPDPQPEPEPIPTLLPQDGEEPADEPEGTGTAPEGEEDKPWWADPQPGARESAWTAKLEEAFADGGPPPEPVDLAALRSPGQAEPAPHPEPVAPAEPTPEPVATAVDDRRAEPGPEPDGGPTGPDERSADPSADRVRIPVETPIATPVELPVGTRVGAPVETPVEARATTPAAPRRDTAGLSPAALAAAAAVVRAPGDVPVFGREAEPETPDSFARFFGSVATVAPEHAPVDRSRRTHPDRTGPEAPHLPDRTAVEPDTALHDAVPDAAVQVKDPGPPPADVATDDEAGWGGLGRPDPDIELSPFGPLLQAPPPDRDQTRIVLIVVGVIVVIGLILAVNGLRGLGGFSLAEDEPNVPIPSVSAPPVTSGPVPTDGPAAQPAGTPIKIAKVQPLDPQGDGEENDGRAKRAVDGKPGTAWSSKTYRNADFGGLKDGLGLGLQLSGTATVRQVVVRFDGEAGGGRLELREAGGMSFDGSTVIAGTAINGGTATLTVNTPVQTRHLVLWCTRLPDSGNGFRLQVSEVEVR